MSRVGEEERGNKEVTQRRRRERWRRYVGRVRGRWGAGQEAERDEGESQKRIKGPLLTHIFYSRLGGKMLFGGKG